MVLREQCDGCSMYWSTGEENKEPFQFFYVHACISICRYTRLLLPPMYFTKTMHQGRSESQDFPAPCPVNWRTRNAPVNDVCPTIALLSQRYF